MEPVKDCKYYCEDFGKYPFCQVLCELVCKQRKCSFYKPLDPDKMSSVEARDTMKELAAYYADKSIHGAPSVRDNAKKRSIACKMAVKALSLYRDGGSDV